MSDPKNVKFSLKAMVNKEKSKVFFIEAGGDFVEVLLSFLTMPLGKLVKVLEKRYGVDQSPVIGSLNTLYKGFTNLHSDNFWTEGAKQMLLNPISSFEGECRRLKLDITDTRPSGYFSCAKCNKRRHFIVSMYCDAALCYKCSSKMRKETCETKPEADGGVFIEHMATYIISDDLHLFAEVQELVQTVTILGITDMDTAELMNATLGINEIMDVLKASIFSSTPLSDIILKKQMCPPAIVKSEHGSTSSYQMKIDASSNSKEMSLKVTVQKSSNKILYVRAGEDFIDFLSSFLNIPLGGIGNLLGSESCFNSINNLYKSVADLIDSKFFKTPYIKDKFTCMKMAHGSICQNQILPLTEECIYMSDSYSSENFPKGQGKYVKALRTYVVADDLTVTPFSMISTISMLSRLNIPMSDIKELELQIGLKEALSILRASLSSTSALSDALNINPTSEKQPKQENT